MLVHTLYENFHFRANQPFHFVFARESEMTPVDLAPGTQKRWAATNYVVARPAHNNDTARKSIVCHNPKCDNANRRGQLDANLRPAQCSQQWAAHTNRCLMA